MIKWNALLRCGLIACLVTLLCVSPVRSAGAASQGVKRALWIWNFAQILPSSTEQAKLFQFLAAPHNEPNRAISTVLVGGLTPGSLADPTTISQLMAFLRDAHDRGLNVQFLCGDPTWATIHQDDAFAYVDAVIRYNRSVAGRRAAFDGLQFDVEPYILPGWPSSEIENGWSDLMKRTEMRIAASQRKLRLSCAIPFWVDSAEYNYVGRGLIDNTDETFIMDYTNKVANIVSFPTDEMSYASSRGKSCWIGVETNNQGAATSTTWYGVGNKAMESALSTDLSQFESRPSFAGYAINDYVGYAALSR